MARQELISGGYYVNEKVTRQYLVPGHGFINELGANVWNISFSESVTAGDSMACVANLTATLSESVTAGFAFSPIPQNRTEFISGGYMINQTGNPIQYFVPGRGYFNDTAPYNFLSGAYIKFIASTSDSATAADNVTVSATFNAIISEFVAAYDDPPSLVFPAAYGKAMYGAAMYGSPGLRPALTFTYQRPSAAYGKAMYGAAMYGFGGVTASNPTFAAPYVYLIK
jgi:hypothetical protein